MEDNLWRPRAGVPQIAGMVAHLVRRALIGTLVVAGVVALTFLLLHTAPGDPVLRLLGPTATVEQMAAARSELGLDQPLPRQFIEWLERFVSGDWGASIASGLPVREILAGAWPATVLLMGLSLLLSYGVGLVTGGFQARRRGTRADSAISVLSVTVFAVPGYWLGLMLIMVFTYGLRWLPAFGSAGLDADFLTGWALVADRLRHLVLPVATLTLIGAGSAARFARGAMVDVIDQPHVVAAAARGVDGRRLFRRHVLRNGAIPIVTLLGLSLPALFSGAVFVEAVFAWPGVGRIMVEAVQARDYPVVMAATTVSAILVVAGNVLADLAVSWVDPRVRH